MKKIKKYFDYLIKMIFYKFEALFLVLLELLKKKCINFLVFKLSKIYIYI